MNKRGLSGVVTTILLIALSVLLVTIVWVAVKNMVVGELDGVSSCMNVGDKVSLNNRYTCYNSSSQELQFSINLGDIDLNELIVAVASEEKTETFKLTNVLSQVTHVYTYPDKNSDVVLPNKNAGLTYLIDLNGAGFTSIPNIIQIVPIINGNSCGVSDAIEPLDNCYSLLP